jgi:hypothetical protein
MKHLKEFESWANGIYEAAIEKPTEKQISRERDIVYQASRDYPDLNKEQALGLYLDDKLKDFDRRDMDQNAVINAQRKENAKLTANLNQLQRTLQSVEDSGKDSDAEIQRLKSLSGKLSTDVQQRQVSSADVARMLAQVEELKNKPGMDEKKYTELKQDLETAKQNISKINPEQFSDLTDKIKTLSGEQTIEKERLAQLGNLAAKLTTQQQDVAAQKTDVMSKLSQLEKRQQELEQREKQIGKEIEDKVKQATSSDRTQKYRKAVSKRSKQASTLIKNFLNRDLPDIYKVTDEKFPEFADATTRSIDLVNNELAAINNKLKSIKLAQSTASTIDTDDEDFTSPQAQVAGKQTSSMLGRFGVGQTKKTREPEMSDTELKENTTYQLNEMADPYEIWSTTGLPRSSVEKYIKSVYTLNKLLDSDSESDNVHADTLLYLFTEVLHFLKNDILALKSNKKYAALTEVIEPVILHVLIAVGAERDDDDLNRWATDLGFAKVILKHSIVQLDKLVNVLEFLEKSTSDKKPSPLNTRGAPTRDFQKLHDEPDEPSTLPPAELFRESIDKMVDTIVGEQVAKWIK